jgi:hypothetical protein
MPVFLPDLSTRATEIIAFLFFCGVFFTAHADTERHSSKRIEVYSLSQNYWDTQNGDTLGEIVLQLLPNNPAKHEKLEQDIVQLNPGAFIGADADKLLAGKRLQLPGYMKQADSKIDPATTVVEQYSWGNIKRPRD